MIEGQLKEKSGGKWKIFKKWKSRYFTLSGKFDQLSKIILASGLDGSVDIYTTRLVWSVFNYHFGK